MIADSPEYIVGILLLPLVAAAVVVGVTELREWRRKR